MSELLKLTAKVFRLYTVKHQKKQLNNYNTGRRKGNFCYNFFLHKVEFGEESELGG